MSFVTLQEVANIIGQNMNYGMYWHRMGNARMRLLFRAWLPRLLETEGWSREEIRGVRMLNSRNSSNTSTCRPLLLDDHGQVGFEALRCLHSQLYTQTAGAQKDGYNQDSTTVCCGPHASSPGGMAAWLRAAAVQTYHITLVIESKYMSWHSA